MTVKEYVQSEKNRLANLIKEKNLSPTLVIIQVNDDPASASYIRGKIKDAAEIGAKTIHDKLPEDISQAELIKIIQKYNDDSSVHGIIVQMPLPKQINEEAVKLAVNPKKDVDGFHPLSTFSPCTPKGIIKYLKAEKIDIQSKNAVIIGRSNIVGKPMAKLLLKENANTTILHSKTKREDMEFYLAHADIVVVAVGKRYFLDHSFKLKEDAVLIDVGINRHDGALCGDIEPDLNVRLQTPVPGGVGLLTRISLMDNLLEATVENEI